MDLRQFLRQAQIKFGTSGIRAKNTALTDEVCYTCTLAFLRYLEERSLLSPPPRVAVAGDLRANTDKMILAVWQALADVRVSGLYLGKIPTPVLGYYTSQAACPGLMITGSHIAADMNGIKFYLASGEILKTDEEAILNQDAQTAAGLFSATGALKKPTVSPPQAQTQAYQAYLRRNLDFFPPLCLAGLRLGVYVHSSVAGALLIQLLETLGATVFPFAAAAQFHSVDTEALTPYELTLAREKTVELKLDAIVSTDGDGDRPLISDEFGAWLRGDVIGMLCAIILQADYVVTPLTSNSSIDELALFKQIVRTRVGSPYVIEAMDKLLSEGKTKVFGYEANGGVLLGSHFEREGRRLTPLPTRDGILPVLSLLSYCKAEGLTLSALTRRYQGKFTASSSLKDFPSERLGWFTPDFSLQAGLAKKLQAFFKRAAAVKNWDASDGLRIYFEDGVIIHLRPSGNSPELRCYTEADSQEKALQLNAVCVELLGQWRDQHHVETAH